MRMRSLLSVAVISSIMMAAPSAHADEEEWYGWQTLVSDGATFAATGISAIAAKGQGPIPAVIFLVGYLVPPPIIHGAHRNGGAALGSLGLRLGLPALGALIGWSIGERDGTKLGNAVLGFAIGVIGAIAIDAAALGYEDKAAAPPASGQQSTGLHLHRPMVFGSTF